MRPRLREELVTGINRLLVAIQAVDDLAIARRADTVGDTDGDVLA